MVAGLECVYAIVLMHLKHYSARNNSAHTAQNVVLSVSQQVSGTALDARERLQAPLICSRHRFKNIHTNQYSWHNTNVLNAVNS